MNALKVLLIDDEEELVSALVERLEIRGVAAVIMMPWNGAASGQPR